MNQPLQQNAVAQALHAEPQQQNDFARLIAQPQKIDVMQDDNAYARVMRMAELMSKSGAAVPPHCRNNIGMCFSIILTGVAWNLNNYFSLAWQSWIEPKSERLNYMAQAIISAAQASGIIKDHFHYEYKGEGDAIQGRCGAILANGDNTIVWGEWMAASVAGNGKNSPLWKTDKPQALAYNRALAWVRSKYPAIIMGVYTEEDEFFADAAKVGSKPIQESDLSTPESDVLALIADINATETHAEQKLLKSRVDLITGQWQTKCKSAYNERTKHFKALAAQQQDPEKPAINSKVEAFVNALNEAENLEIFDAIWDSVPDELGENPELINAYNANEIRLGRD